MSTQKKNMEYAQKAYKEMKVYSYNDNCSSLFHGNAVVMAKQKQVEFHFDEGFRNYSLKRMTFKSGIHKTISA
jgi:hypothetical protein